MRREVIGRALGPTIYALCEADGRPRYVGKTVQWAGERHKEHIRDAKRGGNRPVSRWIKKKIAAGEWLVIKHLEWLRPGDDWAARETYWIARYRGEQPDLLNLTDGGDGLPGLVRSPEHRAKIAAALRTGKEVLCATCAATFWVKRNKLLIGEGKFCSRSCYSRSLVGVSRPVAPETAKRGQDVAAKLRKARALCKRGHSLSGENLYVDTRGSRVCRECRKIHKATYRSKVNG